MGNSSSNSNFNTRGSRDCLRDYSTEANVPQYLMKRDNPCLILALCDTNFYPCLITGPSRTIPNGYYVYFLHNREQTEVPSSNTIGNFKALLDFEISFEFKGRNLSGQVRDISMDAHGNQASFFMCCNGEFGWVELPYIYITLSQFRKLVGVDFAVEGTG